MANRHPSSVCPEKSPVARLSHSDSRAAGVSVRPLATSRLSFHPTAAQYPIPQDTRAWPGGQGNDCPIARCGDSHDSLSYGERQSVTTRYKDARFGASTRRSRTLKRGLLVLAALLAAAALLSGCQSIKIGYVGSNRAGHMAGSYARFTGEESHAVGLKQDQVLRLEYELVAEEGALAVHVQAPDGEATWQADIQQRRDNGTIDLRAAETGEYRVIVRGKDTKGSFDLTWRVE